MNDLLISAEGCLLCIQQYLHPRDWDLTWASLVMQLLIDRLLAKHSEVVKGCHNQSGKLEIVRYTNEAAACYHCDARLGVRSKAFDVVSLSQGCTNNHTNNGMLLSTLPHRHNMFEKFRIWKLRVCSNQCNFLAVRENYWKLIIHFRTRSASSSPRSCARVARNCPGMLDLDFKQCFILLQDL